MRRECRERFPPPPISKETASKRSRHASRHVRDARAVMHVGIACLRWRGKRSRHSRRMRIRKFAYLARGPWLTTYSALSYHLNQWWHCVNWTPWDKPRGSFFYKNITCMTHDTFLTKMHLGVSAKRRSFCFGHDMVQYNIIYSKASSEVGQKSDFGSLWPRDATWWHKTWSTLAQTMACCLTAQSHYLNQFWCTTNKALWHSFQDNFTSILKISIPKLCLKFTHLKSQPHFPGNNELNSHNLLVLIKF